MPDATAGRPAWRGWPVTIRTLSWSDRVLLVETIAIVSLLPVLLRMVRLQPLAGSLGRSLDRRRAGGARVDEPRARQIGRIVAMGSRHTATDNSCLHRSLTLWWLLGRRGLDSSLRMGARQIHGRLDAHAWVEHAGIVINDDPDVARRYTPLSLSAVNNTTTVTQP